MSETEATPSPARRRMQLVSEQQVPDPVASPAASTVSPPMPMRSPPPDLSRELMARAAWRQGIIASLNVATQILAVRLILLVATGGAIGLAWIAAQEHDPYRLGAVGIYVLGVMVPLVWLSSRR